MNQMTVTLPNGVNAELLYGHDYPGGVFDYIQAARTHSLLKKATAHTIEESYWVNLEKYRTQFAQQVTLPFDLIIDPPSNSGWHLPYVSAVRRMHQNVPCINFIKLDPGPGIKAFEDKVPGIKTATKVLIVDDVFSTGKVAGSVIDSLYQYGLNKAATFLIACPLRIPPQPGGTNDEIAAAVAAMSGK